MYGSYMLRAGRTYDIEDSRTTDRLHAAYDVLKALGAEPTIVHGPQMGWDWATNRERHIEACTLHGSGVAGCTITWPAWVTDEMLDAAYGMANTFRTARGAYNRSH